jgi:Magnesium chelatase, subunit ChlI
MLARRLTTILPAMSLAEALETTRVHRVAGLTGAHTAVVTTRPCRAPHHISGSDVALPLLPTPVCGSAHHYSGLHTRSIVSNGTR